MYREGLQCQLDFSINREELFTIVIDYKPVPYGVFLTTVITESYQVKIVLSPTEIVRKVVMLSFVHAPEIEIFQSAK